MGRPKGSKNKPKDGSMEESKGGNDGNGVGDKTGQTAHRSGRARSTLSRTNPITATINPDDISALMEDTEIIGGGGVGPVKIFAYPGPVCTKPCPERLPERCYMFKSYCKKLCKDHASCDAI